MRTIIKSAQIVNEGKRFIGDILIEDGRISKVDTTIEALADKVINAEGLTAFPGLIDDQVHFREPGLTHKAEIETEARAAVAGGVTSFMEMPNTKPQATTQHLLEQKYERASKVSLANYSFYMGTTNENIDEVLRTDPNKVCGIKIFMGSSTGNMLVDDYNTLNMVFSNAPTLIATHCEDEATIRQNTDKAKSKYGEDIPFEEHPNIRSREACLKSSSLAVDLAKKTGARLHVLHISTEEELKLFSNSVNLKDKKITAEACIHHMWFNDFDYATKGSLIKWNPAVKRESDRLAILEAVNNDTIDVIATDHAPHTLKEKQNKYLNAPSGGPLVQHSLLALLDLYKQGKITLEHIAKKTAHDVATLFQIKERGYLREGYWADIVLVNLKKPHTVYSQNVFYKCGWSPFEGHTFPSSVIHTFVSGNHVYDQGQFHEEKKGMRLDFAR
ncbi:MAG: dihydroorotase [Cytophagales bacterium]